MNGEDLEALQEENQRLRVALAEQAALIDARAAILDAQAALIEQLRSRVAELEARLGQDSGNSSVPPSRDRTDRRAQRAQQRAKRQAEVKAAGRKPGKQPGAPGSTLCRRVPDRTLIHPPENCGSCGASLAACPVVGRATRQVQEIPEPRLQAIDHVVERRRCICGHLSSGTFPPEATGPVCWGPRARAAGAYLLARQHLPLERGAEAMRVLFDAAMGEGTLAGLLPEAASKLEGFMDRIADLLKSCPVTHADETSVRVGASLRWVHTVSTPGITYLAAHAKRGIDAITEIGILNHYCGTIVHDGWSSYDRTELAGATHAQCGAHLVRHLDKAAEHRSNSAWASAMKTVLADAKSVSEQAAKAELNAVPAEIAGPIRDRYLQVSEQALAQLPPGPPPRRKHTGGWSHAEREAWNLVTRMLRHQDQVLRLLEDTRVPFTNNEAERSVRMAKLHDKISGCFRSEDHAEGFLTVRSYLQTGAKHCQNSLELLTRLWTPAGAWLPSVAVSDTS